jgi:Sen15 protein
MFAKAFEWVDENIWRIDEELGGRVKGKWNTIVVAIVHPDSTIAYYKVHDGIHKPLEGTAGI